MARPLYVYIMTNRSGTLYVGITRDIVARVQQHRTSGESTFCGKYRLRRLVHLEEIRDYADAIRREKQLKGWTRRRKLALIESANPGWLDLLPESG